RDKDSRIRVSTLHAISNMHRRPEELDPLLVAALKEKSVQVRRAAVSVLSRQFVRNDEVLTSAIELLKSKDETVMGDVIRYLGGTGSSDARAVAALIEHYRTAKSDHQRWWALEALSYCGSNAKDAIPLCAEALKDGSPGLKQFAIRALLKLDPENK